MKKVELKRLLITNFKGIASLEVSFTPETFIYAANGLGKTTINDAFVWLLFGKNAEDKKDFSIKPRSSAGIPSEKIENEVEGLFMVDGQSVTIKRVQREKWVKSRGEVEATFTGNETLFFWNDVPCQAGEFQSKVSELIDEKLFKLITSPYAFAALGWQERRAIITKIVGDVSDSDIAANRKDFQGLMVTLSGKSLEEFKKEISAKKKKLNDELNLIPARVDEIKRGMPEIPNNDMIQIDLNNIDQEIVNCNDQIKDKSKQSEEFYAAKTIRQKRIYELDAIISGIVNDQRISIRSEYSDAESNRQGVEGEVKVITNELLRNNAELKKSMDRVIILNIKRTALRLKWTETNASQIGFNPNEFICPTCKRSFDESDIDQKQNEMTEAFNTNKVNKLQEIGLEGKGYKDECERLEIDVVELSESINLQTEVLAGKQKELSEIKPTPNQIEIEALAKIKAKLDPKYIEAEKETQKLQFEDNSTLLQSNNDTSIEAQRKAFNSQRDELIKKQGNQSIIDKDNARILELQQQTKSFAQQIADLECLIFTMEDFEKCKIDLVERKVNKLFTQLKFKMFTTQINGGMAPACEILINGVPFSDANKAAQYNAGIEIINVLCESNQVNAPIFIDNREAVTEIIPTNSQIINLVVSAQDKQFRII